ncbi:proline iminopeptidase [Bradyrhizobium japonicum]
MAGSASTTPKSPGEIDWKHPQSRCTNSGWITIVDDQPLKLPHRICWAEYGNPSGEPVMFLHGGPGGGCTKEPWVTRFFDPERYRIILFDQRGCGKSRPNAAANFPNGALSNNETHYLIEDIVKLRNELQVAGKMHVFGGSWGSTLGLAYAIKYPDTVQTLVLRSIFLCRKKELNYLYQGNAAVERPGKYESSLAGAFLFFPEAWERFVEPIAEWHDRADMIKAYAAILTGDDEDLRSAAAESWSAWEASVSYLQHNPESCGHSPKSERARASALIETHYFLNGGFLEGKVRDQNYLLNNISKINRIPVHIVHGRYDQVCPLYQAQELVAALRNANSTSVNYVITVAGHSALEYENQRVLANIMDTLPIIAP